MPRPSGTLLRKIQTTFSCSISESQLDSFKTIFVSIKGKDLFLQTNLFWSYQWLMKTFKFYWYFRKYCRLLIFWLMFQNNLSPLQTPSRTSSRNNLQGAKDNTQVYVAIIYLKLELTYLLANTIKKLQLTGWRRRSRSHSTVSCS